MNVYVYDPYFYFQSHERTVVCNVVFLSYFIFWNVLLNVLLVQERKHNSEQKA